MQRNRALRSALEAAYNAQLTLSNAEATRNSSRRELDEDERRVEVLEQEYQSALEVLDRMLDEP